jgi:hypothetical protein
MNQGSTPSSKDLLLPAGEEVGSFSLVGWICRAISATEPRKPCWVCRWTRKRPSLARTPNRSLTGL